MHIKSSLCAIALYNYISAASASHVDPVWIKLDGARLHAAAARRGLRDWAKNKTASTNVADIPSNDEPLKNGLDYADLVALGDAEPASEQDLEWCNGEVGKGLCTLVPIPADKGKEGLSDGAIAGIATAVVAVVVSTVVGVVRVVKLRRLNAKRADILYMMQSSSGFTLEYYRGASPVARQAIKDLAPEALGKTIEKWESSGLVYDGKHATAEASITEYFASASKEIREQAKKEVLAEWKNKGMDPEASELKNQFNKEVSKVSGEKVEQLWREKYPGRDLRTDFYGLDVAKQKELLKGRPELQAQVDAWQKYAEPAHADQVTSYSDTFQKFREYLNTKMEMPGFKSPTSERAFENWMRSEFKEFSKAEGLGAKTEATMKVHISDYARDLSNFDALWMAKPLPKGSNADIGRNHRVDTEGNSIGGSFDSTGSIWQGDATTRQAEAMEKIFKDVGESLLSNGENIGSTKYEKLLKQALEKHAGDATDRAAIEKTIKDMSKGELTQRINEAADTLCVRDLSRRGCGPKMEGSGKQTNFRQAESGHNTANKGNTESQGRKTNFEGTTQHTIDQAHVDAMGHSSTGKTGSSTGKTTTTEGKTVKTEGNPHGTEHLPGSKAAGGQAKAKAKPKAPAVKPILRRDKRMPGSGKMRLESEASSE